MENFGRSKISGGEGDLQPGETIVLVVSWFEKRPLSNGGGVVHLVLVPSRFLVLFEA